MGRDSPLRPELIEAIFYLSLALPGDSMIFDMETRLVEFCTSQQQKRQKRFLMDQAKTIATAINDQSRVDCGFAAVADVTTKRPETSRGGTRWHADILLPLHVSKGSMTEWIPSFCPRLLCICTYPWHRQKPIGSTFVFAQRLVCRCGVLLPNQMHHWRPL